MLALCEPGRITSPPSRTCRTPASCHAILTEPAKKRNSNSEFGYKQSGAEIPIDENKEINQKIELMEQQLKQIQLENQILEAKLDREKLNTQQWFQNHNAKSMQDQAVLNLAAQTSGQGQVSRTS